MRKIKFGFENDGGLGDRLAQSVLRGDKTATCTPKRWYELDPEDTEEVGEHLSVVDSSGRHICTIEITEKYEIPFARIDLRVALAEQARSIEEFFQDHARDFEAMARALQDGEWCLSDETPIVVEHFRVVSDPEIPS